MVGVMRRRSRGAERVRSVCGACAERVRSVREAEQSNMTVGKRETEGEQVERRCQRGIGCG